MTRAKKMSLHSRGFAALAGVIVMCTGFVALAGADSGWYGGVAAGRSDLHIDKPGGYGNYGVVDYRDDGNASGYIAFSGYRTSRYLALELAYSRFDDFNVSYTDNPSLTCPPGLFCPDYIVHYNEQYRLERVDFAVVATVPIGTRWEVLGKMGLARTRNSVEGESLSDFSDSSMDTSIVLGLGARFLITPSWAVRLQWEQSDYQGGDSMRSMDMESHWLGAEYRF